MADRRPDRGDLQARQAQRQRRRMRTVLAAFVVLVVIAAPVALLSRSDGSHVGPAAPGLGELPPGSQTSGAWSSVPVHGSGLGDGSSVRALTSTGDAVLAVGSRTVDGVQSSTVWRSEDGLNWAPVEQPQVSGVLTAVEAHGATVLAVGASSRVGGPADMVWRSTDGGRTWVRSRRGPTSSVHPHRRWAGPSSPCSGGSTADGSPEVGPRTATGGPGCRTTERSGPRRFRTTRSEASISRHNPMGAVLGYWLDQVWRSTDGQVWSRVDPALPSGLGLRSVASGSRHRGRRPFPCGHAHHSDADPAVR